MVNFMLYVFSTIKKNQCQLKKDFQGGAKMAEE